jgi:hypothetical protein
MTNVIIPENIHLIQINWIKENTVVIPEKMDVNPIYNFQITHTMMHNLEKEIVKIGIFVDMKCELNGKQIYQGGSYEADFVFKVDQLQSYYQLIENKPLFEGAFVGTLLGISYSTIRGMLYSSWQKAELGNVILPVISIQELMKSKR